MTMLKKTLQQTIRITGFILKIIVPILYVIIGYEWIFLQKHPENAMMLFTIILTIQLYSNRTK